MKVSESLPLAVFLTERECIELLLLPKVISLCARD